VRFDIYGHYQLDVIREGAKWTVFTLGDGKRLLLFVQAEMRRRGIARRALEWLRRNAWSVRPRVRIDVLVGNHSGMEFWRSVGFTDYCLTMERPV
jgi:GNAT superfamily N-acetyltransferase